MWKFLKTFAAYLECPCSYIINIVLLRSASISFYLHPQLQLASSIDQISNFLQPQPRILPRIPEPFSVLAKSTVPECQSITGSFLNDHPCLINLWVHKTLSKEVIMTGSEETIDSRPSVIVVKIIVASLRGSCSQL